METLAERLRIARRRLGMSQGELGAAAGLSQAAVSRLEHGGGAPPTDTLARLAAALGVEPGWLSDVAGGASPRRAAHPSRDDASRATGHDAFGAMTRLEALAEYRELRDRWLRGEARPGDPRRRRLLRAVLERTGGVPRELRWRR